MTRVFLKADEVRERGNGHGFLKPGTIKEEHVNWVGLDLCLRPRVFLKAENVKERGDGHGFLKPGKEECIN